MSKMTTKELLNHLGIEEGKEYEIDEVHVKIMTISCPCIIINVLEKGVWHIEHAYLNYFLDKEIVLTPTYKLTALQKLELEYMLSIGYRFLRRSYLTESVYGCAFYPQKLEDENVFYVEHDYDFIECKDESVDIKKLLEGYKICVDELQDVKDE